MTRGVYGSGDYVVKYHPKEYHQSYYQKNKEKILKYGKKYYQDHREKLKEAQKRRYKAEKKEILTLNFTPKLEERLFNLKSEIEDILNEIEKKRSPSPEEPTA